MSSVSDELAALRSKGTVRHHASQLSAKSPRNLVLSTPEAEAAALAKLRKEDKVKRVEAVEGLRKNNAVGGGKVEEELKKLGERKKEEARGKNEAKMILSKGGTVTVGSKPSAAVRGVAETGNTANAASETPSAESPKESPKSTDAVPNEITEQTATASVNLSEEVDDAPKMQDEPLNNDVAIHDDEVNDDDDVPELEEANETQDNNEANYDTSNTQHSTTNRNEKKVRKMMSRLDMRPVPGIVRAVMKTPGGNFVIERPDVFATNGKGNETYVIFGEARQQQPMGQMQQRKNAAAEAAKVLQDTVETGTQEANVSEGGEVGKELDTQGLEAKDIELVMTQASCGKSAAIKALKENDGDLVNAIMSLTT
ncbi:hypothetical protein HJC23_011942 [Cyclotella cryptica]|uniref:NAC-A/B domain-containing protein n=1 Tax=Cyclotella cryptica TaxID=29204 RepID=A0ABD3QR06_9STRA|eukprot:CCRYP_002975-RB/>CCRYP_002975-RB protein AED:0.01 eAED:0.01 QI:296/-1/1/1/-1/1/1/246/368